MVNIRLSYGAHGFEVMWKSTDDMTTWNEKMCSEVGGLHLRGCGPKVLSTSCLETLKITVNREVTIVLLPILLNQNDWRNPLVWLDCIPHVGYYAVSFSSLPRRSTLCPTSIFILFTATPTCRKGSHQRSLFCFFTLCNDDDNAHGSFLGLHLIIDPRHASGQYTTRLLKPK